MVVRRGFAFRRLAMTGVAGVLWRAEQNDKAGGVVDLACVGEVGGSLLTILSVKAYTRLTGVEHRFIRFLTFLFSLLPHLETPQFSGLPIGFLLCRSIRLVHHCWLLFFSSFLSKFLSGLLSAAWLYADDSVGRPVRWSVCKVVAWWPSEELVFWCLGAEEVCAFVFSGFSKHQCYQDAMTQGRV